LHGIYTQLIWISTKFVIKNTLMFDPLLEFFGRCPLLSPPFGGRPYRYGFTAHWGKDLSFGPAMKHDLERQTTELHLGSSADLAHRYSLGRHLASTDSGGR
jgi:hypothetical protein